ncbi:PRC-barrel domain-containing protein [Streptomonospora sp. S1-112]|uniref:PRC-barrel domain-containing protein n=1 Tax=Streptomonospora mangrovi TaxID=2883123 RepID=A0A9X3SHX0_9ACTN|nr:PRC-barrel domain-containing protein [Streptomonospora mangrovi]MDA0565754.1 PRC-barrel domain-containing protein [Streptomonospora mangrovi]
MAAQMGTQRLIGHRLVDRDGAAVGKIGQVYYDDQTDEAKWITVRTGLFGSRENLVPLLGAELVYDALQVPWSKSEIKSAPSFDIDQHISVEQEDRVYEHYGLTPEIPGQRPAEPIGRPRGRHARAEQRPEDRPEQPEYLERSEAPPRQAPRQRTESPGGPGARQEQQGRAGRPGQPGQAAPQARQGGAPRRAESSADPGPRPAGPGWTGPTAPQVRPSTPDSGRAGEWSRTWPPPHRPPARPGQP